MQKQYRSELLVGSRPGYLVLVYIAVHQSVLIDLIFAITHSTYTYRSCDYVLVPIYNVRFAGTGIWMLSFLHSQQIPISRQPIENGMTENRLLKSGSLGHQLLKNRSIVSLTKSPCIRDTRPAFPTPYTFRSVLCHPFYTFATKHRFSSYPEKELGTENMQA